MKIRIEGASLRLRLSRKEIAQLRDGGCVESFLEFGPGSALVYLLERSPHSASVTASFDGQTIRVSVPAQVMTAWTESDRVGIEAAAQAGLHLLIEKDFQCLHKNGEQDRDAWPRPLMS